MSDYEGKTLSREYEPLIQEAFTTFHEIEKEKWLAIKELLVKTAKQLFRDDFPKMTFCVQHGGTFPKISLDGIVVHEPSAGDKDHVFVIMFPDGIYVAGGDCKIDGDFRLDLFRPIALWQYTEFAGNAIFALQTAYTNRQKNIGMSFAQPG